jgi:hypothetical protein
MTRMRLTRQRNMLAINLFRSFKRKPRDATPASAQRGY